MYLHANLGAQRPIAEWANFKSNHNKRQEQLENEESYRGK
jgi:hypothetical protein